MIMQMIAQTEAEIQRAERARKSSLADAIEAEGAMLSRYDTMKEEAQYLEGAFSKIVAEQQRNLQLLKQFLGDIEVSTTPKTVSVGAICTIEQETADGQSTTCQYFIVPAGGGISVEVDGKTVKAISPQTPIGRVLMGRTIGEDFDAIVSGRQMYFEVREIM